MEGRWNRCATGTTAFWVKSLHAQTVRVAGEEYVVFSYDVDERPLRLDAHRLTAAEKSVVTLLRAGLSSAEIATRRGTSVRTVSNQLAAIYGKVGVNSRRELCARLESERSSPTRPCS
jgi:DNA-binding CsgD family transcriptional regulator